MPREFRTLGPVVAAWIEEHCVIPDGAQAGEPFLLTDEMRAFLDAFYAVDLGTRRFVFDRGGQLLRPQKWGKGPFSAAMICAEAAGPVLPRWEGDELVGGRAWPTPWIQVTAVSEDQTANVFSALLAMIQLSPSLNMTISDSGQTRIFLPQGGVIEPVTASARSRLGQRVTFIVQDETHSWHQSNGGWTLADNQRRNLAGMGGRFVETSNAFDPVENSVAQRTFESRAPGTLLDDRDPPPGSVRNKRERRKVLKFVYGDSWWVDLDRIDAEIEALLEHDPAQAERYFLNRKLATEGAAFDFQAWKDKAVPRKPAKGAMVVAGVDGALHDDALAVVACEIESGYMWPVGIWERPANAGDEYEHPRHEVDQAVRDLFDEFSVWRVYCDPQWISSLMEGWQNSFGERRVLKWETYRPRPIAWAVRNFEQAVARKAAGGDRPPLSHDGDETLTRHIQNARRRKLTVLDDRERPMHTLSKPAHLSPLKIDGAMAGVLAWEAAGDAIAAGVVYLGDEPVQPVTPEPEPWTPGTAMPLNELALAGSTQQPGDLS